MRELQRELLYRSLEIAGGEAALCTRLGVDARALRAWLDGDASLPNRICLALIDVLTDEGIRAAAASTRSQSQVA